MWNFCLDIIHGCVTFLTKEGFQIFLAVILGGVIGIEREIKGKPAGLRTTILICVGSTLFMIVSSKFAAISGGRADPSRIAAQVATGIGFLGAGTIIQSGGMVRGLTSAATIWVIGAIGLAIGSSQYTIAIGTTVIILVVLSVLGKLEWAILKKHGEEEEEEEKGG